MELNRKKFPDISINNSFNKLKYKGVNLRVTRYIENYGVNSSIFLLIDENNYYPERIIKICNFYENKSKIHKRVERFNREIRALEIAKEKKCNHVIEIVEDGIGHLDIEGKKFKYYIMEKGDYTLTQYIEKTPLDISKKIRICNQILSGVNELHKENIYHRDLKPDNILFVLGEWKICDLGLINSAKDDFIFDDMDERGEKIGPFGWLSPEAMNKFFTEKDSRENLEFNFDCEIDFKSDVFQLGKLFWFIFQSNIPVGQLDKSDFKPNNDEIFLIIKDMLHYNKLRRPNINTIESKLTPIKEKFIA